ncbi:MAG: hypothetical protein AAGA77_07800 [Bacteroidota bacterium]
MRTKILRHVIVPLCFAFILFSNSCKKSVTNEARQSEWITYNSEFDSSRSIVSVVDYDE